MTLDERRLAVALVLFLVLVVRALAQAHAGGLRDQSDGFVRERGRALAWLVRGSALGAMVAVLVWLVTGWHLPGSVALPGWVSWTGVLLLELGAILLIWVQHALGVHLSGTLHLREDHRLVQSGPYARVRHPMYTSFILLFLGIGLVVGNPWLLAVLLGTQAWTVLWRLPAEEASLHERFGQAWIDYRSRTGSLTPWW